MKTTGGGVYLSIVGRKSFKTHHSHAEIVIPIATDTAAMTNLQRIWKFNIRYYNNFNFYKPLAITILLYRCESWTLLVEVGNISGENKCLRKLLCISFLVYKISV